MTNFRSIADIRRDYGELCLNEQKLPDDPFTLFQLWFADVLKNEKNDPTAMVLSTIDGEGNPDSRVVLLKGLEGQHFIFYSNYLSVKALQIANHPYVALNFYWPQMARQVRVRGSVTKLSSQQSDEYFASRPINSQFSAIISPQSEVIDNREFLENKIKECQQRYNSQSLSRPDYWGGYRVAPHELEFWQGRDNRLHDRIHYFYQENKWQFHRLAP